KDSGLKWRSMNSMHGRVYSVKLYGLDLKIIATFHPAAALYNPGLRKELEKDFKIIMDIIYEIKGSSEKKTKSLLDFLR
ncbi:MAG: uracil-DNA glycosylase, partial [Desulfurococcaceae archaeon]